MRDGASIVTTSPSASAKQDKKSHQPPRKSTTETIQIEFEIIDGPSPVCSEFLMVNDVISCLGDDNPSAS
jgi:hypothetical protein